MYAHAHGCSNSQALYVRDMLEPLSEEHVREIQVKNTPKALISTYQARSSQMKKPSDLGRRLRLTVQRLTAEMDTGRPSLLQVGWEVRVEGLELRQNSGFLRLREVMLGF